MFVPETMHKSFGIPLHFEALFLCFETYLYPMSCVQVCRLFYFRNRSLYFPFFILRSNLRLFFILRLHIITFLFLYFHLKVDLFEADFVSRWSNSIDFFKISGSLVMECKRLRILDLYRSSIVPMYQAYPLLFLVISIDFFVSRITCNGFLSIAVFVEH